MESSVCNYVKNEHGKNIGLVVAALCEDGKYNIDYSHCHEWEDTFDKDMARKIAYSRAYQARKNRVKMRIMNGDILHAYMSMISRAKRYFKGCEPSDKVKWIAEKYNFKDFDGSFSYNISPNTIEPRKEFVY